MTTLDHVVYGENQEKKNTDQKDSNIEVWSETSM